MVVLMLMMIMMMTRKTTKFCSNTSTSSCTISSTTYYKNLAAANMDAFLSMVHNIQITKPPKICLADGPAIRTMCVQLFSFFRTFGGGGSAKYPNQKPMYIVQCTVYTKQPLCV